MKILLISNLYEPYARGGAEIIAKRMADGLSEQGHDVTVLTAKPFSGLSSLTLEEEKQDNGVRILRYYPLNVFFYANDHKYPYLIRAFWHLMDLFQLHTYFVTRKLLRRENPDLVISHNLMGLGFTIPAAIRRMGKKHLHEPHDIQLAVRSGLMKRGEEQDWDKQGWPARLYQSAVKRLFGSPEVVLSPSEFLLRFYQKRDFFQDSQTEVLRNPIDKRFFAVGKTEGKNPPVFAYIGQLAEHKGIDTLKNAFEAYKGYGRLQIIGDGPLSDTVQQWAGEDQRVDYLGRVANEALPEKLSETDVIVLPTKTYENAPSVVAEGLAAGIPVIASDIGGAAELIHDGENGIVIPPDDVSALTEAFTLMENADWQTMSSNGREAVKEQHPKRYFKTLEGLIASLFDNRT